MRRSSLLFSLLSAVMLLLLSGPISDVRAQCSQWTTAADTFCTNDPSINLAGTPSPGVFFGPGVTGSTFSPATAGAGNHQIGYSANSCTDTAYVTLRVVALPNVTLAIPPSQRSVCETDVPFAISGNTPNPGWPTGYFTGPGVNSTVGSFDPGSAPTGYNVITYTYDDGVCADSAKDSIEVIASPTANLSPFPVVCESGTPFLLNQGSGTPTTGTISETYAGTGVTGTGPYTFDPAAAGSGLHAITYCYTRNGCETCVTQNILVVAEPNVSLNFTQPFCDNTGPVDLTNSGSPVGGYFSGPGILADSVTFKQSVAGGAGSYNITYTYTDTNGCSGTATRPLTVNPAPVITINAVSPAPTPPSLPDRLRLKICQGDTALISITSSPAVQTLDFFDVIAGDTSLNADSITFSGGNYGLYSQRDKTILVEVTENLGCKDTAQIFLDVIPPARAVITGPSGICIGDSAVLEASGATNYEWLNPFGLTDSVVVVKPLVSGNYSVIAQSDNDGDGNQCSSDTGNAWLTVHPLPIISTGRDTTIFFGDETPLLVYGGNSYVWFEQYDGELSCFNCTNPIAKPLFERDAPPFRVYWVVGTDSNGCSSVDTIRVDLNPKIVVFIPDAFTPNGDGWNDELLLETKGIESLDLRVFDRFGQTVFETTKLEEAWDGTLNNDGGELLPKDVYLYQLKAYPYEKTVPPIDQAGQITLIR